jgi:hypothetical protein
MASVRLVKATRTGAIVLATARANYGSGDRERTRPYLHRVIQTFTEELAYQIS